MKYQLINSVNPSYSAVEQVLYNRGIAVQDVKSYLRTTDDCLLSPKLLNNIKEGAKLYVQHLSKGSKIFIQVDSDVDGYTSAALLYNYTHMLAPTSVGNIVFGMHAGKEHGVIIDQVPEDVSLVVIPDAGSNQYEEHRILKERGIDVLVLDHHECEQESEDAIVINNQLSYNYPNKNLSGVGVAYKFCKFIDEAMQQELADDFLDLVALGMIADMMDMTSIETKHLINKGLTFIKNPFFKSLVDRQAFSLGSTLTPIGVAFYIAPLINASIRVGTDEEKRVIFTAFLEDKAYQLVPSTKRGCKGQFETLVEQAVRSSTNIKNRQKKMRDEGVAEIEKIILEGNLNDNQIILVETSNILNRNLTGLVANQLMAKYQKPVLLLRRTTNSNGDTILQGSGRGYDKSEFNDFKTYLLETGLFDYAEGHANAFGAGINSSLVEEFIDGANQDLAKYDFKAQYNVDFIYEGNAIPVQDILDIANMKPLWGKGIDESMIVIEGFRLTEDNLQLMSADKNPTLKFIGPGGLTMIKFGSSKEEYENLKSAGYTLINLVAKCSVNEWQGRITPQLLIEEYEVLQKVDYYF